MFSTRNPNWLLDPTVCYLNHGSYGATPIPVLDYQQQLREKLEKQPIHFLGRELEGLLDESREILGTFVGANSADLVFVPNATVAVNTILRSLNFADGEEILITSHTYNACQNAVRLMAERFGVKIKEVFIPFPIADPQQVIEAILSEVSPKTKLALLDHVTSPTALILPISTLIKELHRQGVDTLIDGAHAPGFLPVDIQSLAPTYYTGNCHKWLCAPKGAAFLYVRPDKQTTIRPLAISHGANSPRGDRSRFQLEFAWTGTDDPTPYLCIPKALEWMGNLLPGGWGQLQQQNRNLALEARKRICKALDIPLPCPEEMLGAMATIPLGKISLSNQDLYEKLRQDFSIEIPVIPWPGEQTLVRVSAQFYNYIEQYDYLATVLLGF